MNLLTGNCQRVDEGGSMGHPSAAKPEQVDQLLEETKELVEQLKAERGTGMATIRDRMGHCLHGSFTMTHSLVQAPVLGAN